MVDYKNNSTFIKIICPEHGVFEQLPMTHKSGSNCPRCSGNGKLTTVEVISQFKKIHENEYDYSFVDYKNDRTKIKIICPKHGIFEQKPNAHKMGSGCPSCGGKQKLTIPQIINRAQNIHSIDSKPKYHYNIEKYNSVNDIIDIICPEHGIFSQTVISHLSGNGCPKCGKESISKLKRLPQNEIIEQFKMVHSNKYDYSQVQYLNSMEKVQIICPEHGPFFQKPNDHKQGIGCPNCNISKPKTQEETIEQFINVHNNKYNYSKVQYINTKTKVQITRPEHGKEVENKFDYGITAGAGLEVSTGIGHFLLEGRYYMGLSDFYKNSKRDFFERSAHSFIGIRLSYLIDITK
jgi:hypothetical protein